MNDGIGALRARVRLQSPVRSEDELGGAAQSWAEEGAVWAEIDVRGVGESAEYGTQVSRASARVSLRSRDDVRAGWRVAWGVRSFRVLGVVNDGGARTTLVCEEEVL